MTGGVFVLRRFSYEKIFLAPYQKPLAGNDELDGFIKAESFSYFFRYLYAPQRVNLLCYSYFFQRCTPKFQYCTYTGAI